MKNINFLECTFRDGGYYNNWNFSKDLAKNYLKTIQNYNYKFAEIGFRFRDKDKNKGLFAYSGEKLINELSAKSNIQLGIMINASDYCNLKKKKLDKIFSNLNTSKIKFIRIAAHRHEIFKLSTLISSLRKKNKSILLFINVMQCSEIKIKEIKKLISFIYKIKINKVYLADSLGSLDPVRAKKLFKEFSKNKNLEFGFHGHNNLDNALLNTKIALKNGFKWIDSTILGMGRGAGNTTTEDVIGISSIKKKTQFKREHVFKKFLLLKKKYKWGTNKYYKYSAKKKIHPTYVQKLLSEKKYQKFYDQILKRISNLSAKNYNYKTYFNSFFLNKVIYHQFFDINKFKNFNKVLILGSNQNIKKKKKKIEDFIKSYKSNDRLLVISLNTNSNINEKYVDLRVACNPLKIISDINDYKKFRTPIVMPLNMLPPEVLNKMSKDNIFNFRLEINKDFFKFKKNSCTLFYPLAVNFALAICWILKVDHIFLAGFKKANKNNSLYDETESVFKFFLKKFKNYKFLTKSNFNI